MARLFFRLLFDGTAVLWLLVLMLAFKSTRGRYTNDVFLYDLARPVYSTTVEGISIERFGVSYLT